MSVLFDEFILLSYRNMQVFEKHGQNLNAPQNNSDSWELQMGINTAFKGLIIRRP